MRSSKYIRQLVVAVEAKLSTDEAREFRKEVAAAVRTKDMNRLLAVMISLVQR